MKIKDWFEGLVERNSKRIGKMPDYGRVKLEVYIYAYLVLAFLFLIFAQGFIHNTFQTVLYSIGAFGMLAQFISKSNLYRKLKFLNQLNSRLKNDETK